MSLAHRSLKLRCEHGGDGTRAVGETAARTYNTG